MKTAEEILDNYNDIDVSNFERRFTEDDCIKAMKEYAKQVAEKVRQDCADNAKIKSRKGQREEISKVSYPHFDGWEISVDKQSILSTKIELT